MKKIEVTVRFTVRMPMEVDTDTFSKLDRGVIDVEEIADETKACELVATTDDVDWDWDYRKEKS